MISKELLSVVLKVDLLEHLKLYGKTDITFTNGNSMVSINIHELAHKCKEWAFNLGCTLESAHVTKGSCTSSYCKIIIPLSKNDRNIYHEDTEAEAIFKACQYILEAQTSTQCLSQMREGCSVILDNKKDQK